MMQRILITACVAMASLPAGTCAAGSFKLVDDSGRRVRRVSRSRAYATGSATIAKQPAPASTLKYIPNERLAVSEPNPRYFGNGENEENNKAWTNKNWLKSRFHFSFAEYFNLANTRFGAMRVMNDDLVQPKRGFGTHPHRDAEIVTYVVNGQLTHKDSMGTKESLGRGSIQFMTAGTGVRHSEVNQHEEPLRFIQMWFSPTESGLEPNYGSMIGSRIDTKNKWGHLVSWVQDGVETPVKINADVNVFTAELDGSASPLSFELGEDRQAYFLAVEGSPSIVGKKFGSQQFKQHDAAELYGNEEFSISGPGHVLVVEMKRDGNGRTDIL